MQENILRKLDLVVEGQQSLVARMDRFEGRMDSMEMRLERVGLIPTVGQESKAR